MITRSKAVQLLASALSPCYLRMGGTDADFLIFKENSSSRTKEQSTDREITFPFRSPASNQSLHKDWKLKENRNIKPNTDINASSVRSKIKYRKPNGTLNNRSKRDVGYYGNEKKDLTNFTMSG